MLPGSPLRRSTVRRSHARHSLVRRSLAVAVVAVAVLGGCSKSGSSSDGDVAKTTTTAKATTTTAADTGAGDEATTTTEADADVNPWAATAEEHRGQDGKTFSYECPAGGNAETIWGTETYTDDSSVCTAAVHVGLITLADGGTVKIEIAPGEDSYPASTGNDIVSVEYGPWEGSFTFPDAPPGSGTFDASPASWSVTADSLDLGLGDTAEVNCSPGGQIATVYGTGTYTSDSYVCTAAVHSGLITQEKGGLVRIELVHGLDAFKGTTAHGVTSVEWGAFDPAFTFPDDQPAQK